jgi:hypothetical protein
MTISVSPSKRFSKMYITPPSLSARKLAILSADHFYHGSKSFVLSKSGSSLNHLPFMRSCLKLSRDTSFPFHPELWLTSAGFAPTWAWSTSRLRFAALGPDAGGHFVRSGPSAATSLALDGVSDSIQAWVLGPRTLSRCTFGSTQSYCMLSSTCGRPPSLTSPHHLSPSIRQFLTDFLRCLARHRHPLLFSREAP